MYYTIEEINKIKNAIKKCTWGAEFINEYKCEDIIFLAQLCGTKETIEIHRVVYKFIANLVEDGKITSRETMDDELFDLLNRVSEKNIFKMPKKNKEGKIEFNRKNMVYAIDKRKNDFADIDEKSIILPMMMAENEQDVAKKSMFI